MEEDTIKTFLILTESTIYVITPDFMFGSAQFWNFSSTRHKKLKELHSLSDEDPDGKAARVNNDVMELASAVVDKSKVLVLAPGDAQRF